MEFVVLKSFIKASKFESSCFSELIEEKWRIDLEKRASETIYSPVIWMETLHQLVRVVARSFYDDKQTVIFDAIVRETM